MGVKGYKAFEKGLVCKGKQYEENKVYEEPEAIPCKCGMHFCLNPLDVLDYYPLIDDSGNLTEFAEVEALEDPKTDDSKKYCTTKLKISAKLSLFDFIKVSAKVLRETITKEVKESTKDIKSSGDRSQLAGGCGSQLAGGNRSQLAGGCGSQLAGGNRSQLAGGCGSQLAVGNWSQLAGGDESQLAGGCGSQLAGGDESKLAGGYGSQLAGGDESKLAGGCGSQLAGGNRSQLAGGNWSKLAGGNGSQLAGGNRSQLAGGKESKLAGGEGSVIIGDNGSIAKAGKGSIIVLFQRNDYFDIINFKAELVDGERIKEDTWYKLIDGEFVEVRNE